jgi:hypothetical protein
MPESTKPLITLISYGLLPNDNDVEDLKDRLRSSGWDVEEIFHQAKNTLDQDRRTVLAASHAILILDFEGGSFFENTLSLFRSGKYRHRTILVSENPKADIRALSEYVLPNLYSPELFDVITRIRALSITGNGYAPTRENREVRPAIDAKMYAEILADALNRIPRTEPVTLAILSSWGRGKTYLSNLLADKLTSTETFTIRFSAWQYRTTNEIWSFLYQTVLEGVSKHRKLYFRSRFAVLQNGLSALWEPIAILFILTLPIADRYTILTSALSYATPLIQITGFFSLLRIIRTWKSIHSRASTPSYESALGLQHAIGADLRRLLIAAVRPLQTEHSSCGGTTKRTKLESMKRLLCNSAILMQRNQGSDFARLVAISMAFSLFMYIILCSVNVNAKPLNADNSDRLLYQLTFAYRIFDWVALACSIISFLWFTLIAIIPPRRGCITLIVDDLDRCPADVMLTVIECLLLFLDDPEIKARLHLVFLVEENSLKSALLDKYKNAISGTPGVNSQRPEAQNAQVYLQQLEKHFLFWLRLNSLSEAQRHEVATHICRQMLAAAAGDGGDDVAVQTATGETAAPNNAFEAPIVVSTDSTSLLSEQEDALIRWVFSGSMGKAINGSRSEWTPRGIRSLVQRYMLAREIYKTRTGQNPDTLELLEKIEVAPAEEDRSVLEEVASAVR